MLAADRTGYIDDSIDQFGPGPGRHRLVERVKRGLVEPQTFDQRARRGFRCRAIGHELTSLLGGAIPTESRRPVVRNGANSRPRPDPSYQRPADPSRTSTP